ncbi:MAG: SDR family oxidoreductase [Dehalococcoidales bacterium]|nr:SDR family oxidoreductase [Dehalococcoidales bacterium]
MTAKDFVLNGKKTIVVGESKFWTKAVVDALASAGADIAIIAKKSPKLDETVELARKAGRKVSVYSTDISNPQQIQKSIQQAIAELGKIDVLVNATDITFFAPFLEMKDADWQKAMDYNLNSVVSSCRAVGKQMLAQKKGRIINIISCLAERGIVNGTAYCTSMGAVLELSRALALEWAEKGITVNAIGTGWFAGSDKEIDESILRYLPLKRYGKPEEIGPLVVYLASDATDFVSGQFLFVDGAIMAHP